MKLTTNKFNKPFWIEVELGSKFSQRIFYKVDIFEELGREPDVQFAFHCNLGSITVLDRLTGYGFGIRDTETGFRDVNGKFWLASGMFDIRQENVSTVGEAIELIKLKANNCRGE